MGEHDTADRRAPLPAGPSAGADTVLALTISQPYAEAILAGVKTIETRSWPTSHRGTLALHAGLRWWRAGELGRAGAEHEATDIARRLGLALPVGAYARGALVGTAQVVECFEFTPASWERLRADHGVDAPWQGPRYGWRLADVRRLPQPVPYRGALGLFSVPAALLHR